MDQRRFFPLGNQQPLFNNDDRIPVPPLLSGNPTCQQNLMKNCDTMRLNSSMMNPPLPNNQFVTMMPPRGPPSSNININNVVHPPFFPMPDMTQPPPFAGLWQQLIRRPPEDIFKLQLFPSRHNPSSHPWMQATSHHISNASIVDAQSLVKDFDKMLIEQFLFKISKLNNQGTKQQNTKPKKNTGPSEKTCLKICKAKKMQTRARHLVKNLEELSCNCEENMRKISEYKDELQGILSILSDKSILSDLQSKVSQRRKKRHRIKELKQISYQKRVKQEKTIEEVHEKIAKWQEKEQKKLDTQKREEEMQKQLDEALLELRRKLNAVTKCLDIVNSVASLRKIRLNSLKSRGQDPPTQSSTKHFSNAARSASEALQDYKYSCISRIISLKKFVEAGQGQAKLEMEKEKKKKLMKEQKKVEEERNEVLFGKYVELDAFDPVWPMQQLHKQAEMNLPNLVQCRYMWDHFINESEGSSTPVDWVLPPPPSSEEWVKYLIKDTPTVLRGRQVLKRIDL